MSQPISVQDIPPHALANLPTCQTVWKNTPSRTENSLKITPEILDKRVCRVVYLQLSTNTKNYLLLTKN